MSDCKKDIILIVDDQPDSLKILLSFLQNQDFELRILQNGEQAVNLVQHLIPDIILLDVLMPELDGFETCKRIRKNKMIADIPIIFMTALNSVEDKMMGFKVGGVDYITKPFQQSEVLARVNTHLNLRKKALKLKKTQDKLRYQKTMLESLLHSIPDPIYFKNLENKYLGCNHAFEEFAGKTKEEILGKTDEILFAGAAATFLQGKSSEKQMEEAVCYPDGREVFFDLLRTPYIDPNGNPLGWIGLCRNITDLKKAELRAEEERERLSVTLHSIGDAVITTDVTGKIISINKVAEQLTGWCNADASGKASSKVFRIVCEENEPCLDPVLQVLKNGMIVHVENHRVLIRHDGTRLSIANSCAPIRDRTERIIGTVVVFRDVTHEKKMIEELIKIKKLESVGLLAGGIAHDFNNILSAILGNIELAASQVRGDFHTLSLLLDAQKATERAAKLTHQLLTFSKGGEPIREKTSLVDLVRESADFVLRGSSVSCKYSFADDLWMINADSGQISQVIQNIILNAKYAMPDGGTIKITCCNMEGTAIPQPIISPKAHEGRFVHIVIQDPGTGIPTEIMDKIFDPYFTTRSEGNGLGLAICHSIIKKHDGYIMVQSSHEAGSTFSIYLPAVQPTKGIPTVFPSQTPAVQPTRIMVMDDDTMLRRLAEAQLRALGHEAILVADGEEAIDIYCKLLQSERPVDLVIMDLTIPGGMGGQEAAQRLLAIHPEARLIVASGYLNDPVLAAYKKYGFQAAVAKPFNLQELSKAIAATL
ncbi:MAG: response regulator [Candidatus Electrothrix sp. AR3]|nr:response regulator [Candidatus Electrothrix sp. AR3]